VAIEKSAEGVLVAVAGCENKRGVGLVSVSHLDWGCSHLLR
jgi:hypothetical protein